MVPESWRYAIHEVWLAASKDPRMHGMRNLRRGKSMIITDKLSDSREAQRMIIRHRGYVLTLTSAMTLEQIATALRILKRLAA